MFFLGDLSNPTYRYANPLNVPLLIFQYEFIIYTFGRKKSHELTVNLERFLKRFNKVGDAHYRISRINHSSQNKHPNSPKEIMTSVYN